VSGPAKARVRQKIVHHNFVTAKIGNIGVKALVDTGAFYSCVSSALIKRLKFEPKIIPISQRKRLFTADGNAMNVLGTVQLTLDIQEFQIPLTFCVLPRLQNDVILGIDFLRQTKANIDMHSQILTLYDDLVGINLLNNSDTIVRTTDAVLIPPKSEALIPVMVPPEFGPGLSIVEPSFTVHKLQLALAKSIVKPVRNRTVCKVLNPTNVARFIKRKTPLGVIQKLFIDSVTVVDEDRHISDNFEDGEVENELSHTQKFESLTEKGINLQQNSLTTDEFYKLVDLVYRNIDLFATSMYDLIGTDVEMMHIDTGDAKPVRKRAYRQSPEMQRVMEKQIDEMLAAKIIEPSESPWSSPCLLIKKSGTNEYRFVNDLRAVNKLTAPIFWPLPTLEDIFDTVSDKNPRLFTNIDMKHAYFQVFLDEESRPKTAFTMGGKNYQYTRMVMGLSNSAQTWQRLLTKVLSDMLFKSAIVYLDDVLLMSKDFPEHYKHLEMLFQKFRDANLRMNGKKCSFAKDEIKYIGHVLSKDGVSIDPSKTEVISSWPRPKTAKQIRSLLGMTNFYKRFIERYSQRSAALRNLLAKDVPFEWGEAQENAFQDLKAALMSPPILRFPDSSRPFYLQTDASLDGISYILGQTDDKGRKFVISYGGRGLRPCEKKWPITQLECLSLLTGIREYHVYLAAAPFVIYTDHVSLKYLQSLKVSAHNRLARWALALQPYQFTIEHVEGKKLTAADGLSRRTYDDPQDLSDDEELQEDSFIAQIDSDIFGSVTDNALKLDRQMSQWHVLTLNAEDEINKDPQTSSQDTMTADGSQDIPPQSAEVVDLWSTQGRDIETLQHESKDLRPILDWLEEGTLPESDKDARQIILQAENFQIVDGLLYHLYHPRIKRLNEIKPVIQQLCVPDVLREELMVAYHDNNSHVGRERLYDTLKQKYYFPQMYTSVIEYVTSCDICQKTKTSPHTRKAPLSPLPVVEPFGRVHIDHVGPLPKTPEGYCHLLVVVDATTLWCEAFPCKTTTAEETASILYREIICRYGTMKAIETDGGTAFRNKLMTELCKLLQIKHIFSSPMHPAGNAKVERINRTLMTSLKLVCSKQEQWAQNIAPVLYSYRATVAIPLGISPFQALFGRQMSVGIDLTLLKQFESAPTTQAFTSDLISKLQLTHQVIQENMKDRAQRSKVFYDKNSKEPEIAVGSKVLLHSNVLKTGESPKFHKNWVGPYLVISKSDDGLLYRLRHCSTGKESRAAVHANRLKLYRDDRDAFFLRHNIKPTEATKSVSTPVSDTTTTVDDTWYPIEKIMNHKKVSRKDYFLVKWLDLQGSRSWEPYENVTQYAIDQYYIEKRHKARKRSKRQL